MLNMCLSAMDGDQPTTSPFERLSDAATLPRPVGCKAPPVDQRCDSPHPPAALGGSPRSPFDAEALSAALDRLRGGAVPPDASIAVQHSKLRTASGDGPDRETCADAADMQWDDHLQAGAAAATAAYKAQQQQSAFGGAGNALHTWSYSDALLLPRQDSFEKKWGSWADDMIDACLADSADLDSGSNVDSEFGGAAACEPTDASSLRSGVNGSNTAISTEPPQQAAFLGGEPGSASKSNREAVDPLSEAGAAGGVSTPFAAQLPVGWKLADRESEQQSTGERRGGNAAMPLTRNGMKLPGNATGALTVLAAAIAAAWWLVPLLRSFVGSAGLLAVPPV